MQLSDLITRVPVPTAWAEGDNIPWSEPAFSQRMLQEHLSQEHDMASRTTPYIDRQIAWIDETLLASRPSDILDLGCGPGLYSNRLASLGHRCRGIDYSPASIRYARENGSGLACTYDQADLRQAAFGESDYDLVMLLFGETNVFSTADIRLILTKAALALKPGGTLLLEPHTDKLIKEIGESGASWYTSEGGLFSTDPHLMLTEHFWDEESKTATVRHYVVDAESGTVSGHAQSFQAYTDAEYGTLLQGCGYESIKIWPSLGNIEVYFGQLLAITAQKP